MTWVRQQSLFDGEEPRLRALGAEVVRTELGGGAWIELRRGWITGSRRLFDRLLASVPLRAEERVMYGRVVDVPRLVCFYEEGAELPDPVLADALAALNERYGAEDPLRTVGCCLYRDGGDSVAWHGDRIGRGAEHDVTVAVLSLGGPRRFLLRPRTGGTALRFALGGGDLLVMGGSCQRTWEHSVPKTTRPVEPRMSVQFRPSGVR